MIGTIFMKKETTMLWNIIISIPLPAFGIITVTIFLLGIWVGRQLGRADALIEKAPAKQEG